jgi:hypothetical protein
MARGHHLELEDIFWPYDEHLDVFDGDHGRHELVIVARSSSEVIPGSEGDAHAVAGIKGCRAGEQHIEILIRSRLPAQFLPCCDVHPEGRVGHELLEDLFGIEGKYGNISQEIGTTVEIRRRVHGGLLLAQRRFVRALLTRCQWGQLPPSELRAGFVTVAIRG